MPGYDSFGDLLQRFRARLGDQRQTIGWLAAQLGCASSTVYGWENGDPSKGLPSRERILRIGQLYSLSAQEVDDLLAACRARRGSSARRFTALTSQEVSTWRRVSGPTAVSLDLWRDRLELAQTSYLEGELRSSLRMAQRLLDEIQSAAREPAIYGLWREEERREMTRLWMLGWRELFESASFLHDETALGATIAPYLAQARRMARATTDPALLALGTHIEGDALHIANSPRIAMDHHFEAEHLLSKAGSPFFLTALNQRLMLLDGMRALSRHHLRDQVAKARRLAEKAGSGLDSRHARALLLESIGRALTFLDDADAWNAIDYAEAEARVDAPIGAISALYTRTIALIKDPNRIDVDYLRATAAKGLALASSNGWERRVKQFERAVALGNVRR